MPVSPVAKLDEGNALGRDGEGLRGTAGVGDADGASGVTEDGDDLGAEGAGARREGEAGGEEGAEWFHGMMVA